MILKKSNRATYARNSHCGRVSLLELDPTEEKNPRLFRGKTSSSSAKKKSASETLAPETAENGDTIEDGPPSDPADVSTAKAVIIVKEKRKSNKATRRSRT